MGECKGELGADFGFLCVPRQFLCLQTCTPWGIHLPAAYYLSGVALWAWPDCPKAFLIYCTRTGNFVDGHHSGNYKDEPALYWQFHHDDSRAPIYRLAYRLHNTLGSSVPSERAFSAMKLTHSRLCAALTTERVDKLLYIQVNCRVLRRLYNL